MEVPNVNSHVRPRTAEAQLEFEKFKAAYTARLKAIELIPLTVLVWGPGISSRSSVAKKRVQIREELSNRGFLAFFSEELDADLPETTTSVSLLSREHNQAHLAHLVVILVEDSPGALAEAEAFGSDPDIAPKVFVLAPEKYRQGFSAQGTFRLLADGYGGMYWYQDKELPECNVLTQVLIRAQARREIFAKYRISRGVKP